jgi:hypothetical protein
MDKWRTVMRRNALAVLAAFFTLAVWPAHAQVNVDMNRITCRNLLGYDSANKNFVAYWMSGYYSASKNNDVLDFERLQKNADRVVGYCRKHKSDPLPKAINKNAV